ncbi:hypothetical protein CANARDRAFT_26086 [[Candida] arabinofermentans NRRL YB-2248]|uniref:Xylanolytic transcriptional activator regulatory domain-containing protein n=1 Tax=[Candida] arabinofermentans NRRL YB-2248 TaxID=983967 RepID=A0A1E4T820_9ASCO|nr:hypothetical protein CANARDRAFT_26086 [[Candida] arabinofermentans NRRL YB-2248]
MYANVIQHGGIKSQFITATQPLAPLLSRDSFLALSDGDLYNHFYPWRDVFLPKRDTRENEIDSELLPYLNKRGAFEKPPIEEQKRLIGLYLDNSYPILPVVHRDILNQLDSVPPILLNALLLSGVRYDSTLTGKAIRIKADEFKRKCKLLEIVEKNKITLIQSYLLLCAHEESPQGAQISREYLSKANNLVQELGLHIFSSKNQFSFVSAHPGQNGSDPYPNGAASNQKEAFKHFYKKSLLSRLFWISFCCDRVIAVTSCCAMYYNKLDLIVDEPKLEDFDGNRQDYEIFIRWYSNCDLLERIIGVVYRPPGNRYVDYNLERDILQMCRSNCGPQTVELVGDMFARLIVCCNAFSAILYLRSKVDFISLLEDESDTASVVESNSPLTDNKMYYLNKFYKNILNSLKPPMVEHIIVVHSILHVMVLLHLEIEARKEVEVSQVLPDEKNSMSSPLIAKKKMFDKCMKLLEQSSSKWFFGAAAYYLCQELLSKRQAGSQNRSSTDLMSLITDEPCFTTQL